MKYKSPVEHLREEYLPKVIDGIAEADARLKGLASKIKLAEKLIIGYGREEKVWRDKLCDLTNCASAANYLINDTYIPDHKNTQVTQEEKDMLYPPLGDIRDEEDLACLEALEGDDKAYQRWLRDHPC